MNAETGGWWEVCSVRYDTLTGFLGAAVEFLEAVPDFTDDAALLGAVCCLIVEIGGAVSSTSQLHYLIVSDALAVLSLPPLPGRIRQAWSCTVCMASP